MQARENDASLKSSWKSEVPKVEVELEVNLAEKSFAALATRLTRFGGPLQAIPTSRPHVDNHTRQAFSIMSSPSITPRTRRRDDDDNTDHTDAEDSGSDQKNKRRRLNGSGNGSEDEDV